MIATRRSLAQLRIADPPERWDALGFAIGSDSSLDVGGVRLLLGGDGHGITSWTITGLDLVTTSIDGLATEAIAAGGLTPAPTAHPNGAIGIDQVVITTPDFDRTSLALDGCGIPLRRVTEARGTRQGFRRLGAAILEVVETAGARADEPARFWGLVVIVENLDALAERLGDLLGTVRPAVQPGRRIGTLREAAGLTPHVAFMASER